MPNNYDFSKFTNIKEIVINPRGWVNPLTIEYSIGYHLSETPQYFWRIKGTTHTFIIPIIRLNFLSGGNYEKHFTEVLEFFKSEYIEWAENNFELDWQQDYKKQYKNLIIL